MKGIPGCMPLSKNKLIFLSNYPFANNYPHIIDAIWRSQNLDSDFLLIKGQSNFLSTGEKLEKMYKENGKELAI